MAATRLIVMHINKGKTIAQCLHDRTDYAKNPEKTEKGELVIGDQCDPMTVDEEFLLSKRQYQHITGRQQKNNVLAYQIRQSFKPGEITPEEANRLGHELAMRFTKGEYAFIVATHTDKAHVHNHIIFNSTSLSGRKKFRNFFFSGLALQKVSDLVCLENGLSVIDPKPYRDRNKRTTYPDRPSHRQILCEDIDAVLERKPRNLHEFLQLMAQADYEFKEGKNLAFRKKGQKRFIRLSSLNDGYKEADIRNQLSGRQTGKKKYRSQRKVNLILDIQGKMVNKGPRSVRWAKTYNLKQLAKSLLFLRDHNINSVEELNALVAEKVQKRDSLLASVQESEKRLAEIAALKKHIINYSKTRPTYEAYRKDGYSKKFLEAHREEITLHRAAKQAFDELGVKKIPKAKELSVEYAQVLAEKKELYAEFRKVRDEMQEFVIVQKNVESFYEAERNQEEERQLQQEQKNR